MDGWKNENERRRNGERNHSFLVVFLASPPLVFISTIPSGNCGASSASKTEWPCCVVH